MRIECLGFAEAYRAARLLSRRKGDLWRIHDPHGAELLHLGSGQYIARRGHGIVAFHEADCLPQIPHEWLEKNDWVLDWGTSER